MVCGPYTQRWAVDFWKFHSPAMRVSIRTMVCGKFHIQAMRVSTYNDDGLWEVPHKPMGMSVGSSTLANSYQLAIQFRVVHPLERCISAALSAQLVDGGWVHC
mmetsp:Transcript_17311/g.47669  ORF Transcript_17311/g.47669 Transcript_17311/m.47669 type:complete len:103 (-) Transcript_17311:253-561(-)